MPHTEDRTYESELCEACEKVSGKETIFACQKAFGSFRIHAINEQKRALLITNGIEYRGVRIFPLPSNPNRVWTHHGVVVQTEDLTVSAAPLSLSEESILESIENAGYVVLGEMKLDSHRNRQKKVTRFKNGNRSMTIVKPTKLLPSTLLIQDQFRVFLNYRNREEIEKAIREEQRTLNYTHSKGVSLSISPSPAAPTTEHSDPADTGRDTVRGGETGDPPPTRTTGETRTSGESTEFPPLGENSQHTDIEGDMSESEPSPPENPGKISSEERQLLDKIDDKSTSQNARVGSQLRQSRPRKKSKSTDKPERALSQTKTKTKNRAGKLKLVLNKDSFALSPYLRGSSVSSVERKRTFEVLESSPLTSTTPNNKKGKVSNQDSIT